MFASPSHGCLAMLGKEQPSPHTAMTMLCCLLFRVRVKLNNR